MVDDDFFYDLSKKTDYELSGGPEHARPWSWDLSKMPKRLADRLSGRQFKTKRDARIALGEAWFIEFGSA